MSAAFWLAIVGLVLSVASLTWQFATFRLTGSLVRAELVHGAMGADGATYGAPGKFNVPMMAAQASPPSGTFGLKITVANRGPIAARFVAVRVTFSNWRWQFQSPNVPRSWHADYSTNPFFERVTWEGGADAVVHPTWPYLLPLLGNLVSNRSFGEFKVPNDAGEMVPDIIPKTIDFTVEIVADRMRPTVVPQSIRIS